MVSIVVFQSKIFLNNNIFDNNAICWVDFENIFMNKTIKFIEIFFQCLFSALNNLFLMFFLFGKDFLLQFLFLFILQRFWLFFFSLQIMNYSRQDLNQPWQSQHVYHEILSMSLLGPYLYRNRHEILPCAQLRIESYSFCGDFLTFNLATF